MREHWAIQVNTKAERGATHTIGASAKYLDNFCKDGGRGSDSTAKKGVVGKSFVLSGTPE